MPRPASSATCRPGRISNALLVSGEESKSGQPAGRDGPADRLLRAADPDGAGPARPGGIDARGVAFAGVNLFVQLGRGADYAWSATSAGQDIIDTFAERLCDADGSRATVKSTAYRVGGQCRADARSTCTREHHARTSPTRARAETYDAPGAADPARHRPGARHGRRQAGRASRASARPTSTRSTRCSASRSSTTPAFVRNASDFQAPRPRSTTRSTGSTPTTATSATSTRATTRCGRRAPTRSCRPGARASATGRAGTRTVNTAAYTADSTSTRRSSTRSYITSWNNKQAPGFARPRTPTQFGSVHRSTRSTSGSSAGSPAASEMNLAGLVDAMEDAGTVDLRGSQVLPWMLEVVRPAERARRRDGRGRRAAGLGRAPARSAGDQRPTRRLRPRRRDPDHGRLVAARPARRSSGRARHGAVRRRCHGRRPAHDNPASTSAAPTRTAGTATCRRTCGACSAPRSAPYSRKLLRQGQPAALPRRRCAGARSGAPPRRTSSTGTTATNGPATPATSLPRRRPLPRLGGISVAGSTGSTARRTSRWSRSWAPPALALRGRDHTSRRPILQRSGHRAHQPPARPQGPASVSAAGVHDRAGSVHGGLPAPLRRPVHVPQPAFRDRGDRREPGAGGRGLPRIA